MESSSSAPDTPPSPPHLPLSEIPSALVKTKVAHYLRQKMLNKLFLAYYKGYSMGMGSGRGKGKGKGTTALAGKESSEGESENDRYIVRAREEALQTEKSIYSVVGHRNTYMMMTTNRCKRIMQLHGVKERRQKDVEKARGILQKYSVTATEAKADEMPQEDFDLEED